MSFRLLVSALSALLATAIWAAGPALAQDAEEAPEPEVSAEPAPPSPWDRFLAVSVTGGLDTPFGIGGAAVEVTPFRYLTVYAGGGVGRDGYRFAGGLLPQIPIDNASLGLMLGVTGGPLDWDTRGVVENGEQAVIHRHWEIALFFHSAVTFEYRWNEGFFGRLAVGMEALIEPGSPEHCSVDGVACDAFGYTGEGFKPVRGWVGLTVGYAFEL